MDQLKIVDATPDHAPFLAWVMLAAFRSHLSKGFWDFILEDEDEAGKLEYLTALATTDQPHWAHYSIFLVAEVGGKPASALGGYFAEELGDQLRTGLVEANERTGRTQEQMAAGFQRAGTISNVAPDHARGAWIVENVATLPDYRRRGLIDRLLHEIIDRGKARGASTADVSVFIGNDPAQRAYERCGFETIAEKRDYEFEVVYRTPGVRTFRRAV